MSREHLILGTRLKEAARRNQSAADFHGAAVARFLGINHTDGRCLELLERNGRMTPGQLAEGSGLTTGAVTAVLDRLESLDYVRRVRDLRDRRRIWVELTDTLRELMAPLYEHYVHLNDAIMTRFSREQVEAIVAYLEIDARINEAFGAHLDGLVEEGADNDRRRHRVRNYLASTPALIDVLKREIGKP